jgi:hypothetical protein
MGAPSWRAAGRTGTSSASSSPLKMPPTWATCAASPATSCGRWNRTWRPGSIGSLRGVTDDGKILNIAGDYIAHGIRHRASELVTRELGHQSEIEVTRKLASEVDADRLTRFDQMLIAECGNEGMSTSGRVRDRATLPGRTATS